MMEKNGNTYSKGNRVAFAPAGSKYASPREGEVLDVDVDKNMVRVRWDQGQVDEWVNFETIQPA